VPAPVANVFITDCWAKRGRRLPPAYAPRGIAGGLEAAQPKAGTLAGGAGFGLRTVSTRGSWPKCPWMEFWPRFGRIRSLGTTRSTFLATAAGRWWLPSRKSHTVTANDSVVWRLRRGTSTRATPFWEARRSPAPNAAACRPSAAPQRRASIVNRSLTVNAGHRRNTGASGGLRFGAGGDHGTRS
jgi:hypothetical protein